MITPVEAYASAGVSIHIYFFQTTCLLIESLLIIHAQMIIIIISFVG